MAARRWYKPAVLLGLIATEQQQVADTQKLQVEQLILDILDGSTAADNMRLHRNMVSLLDGGSDGYRTRAATDALPFKLSILQFPVHEL